MHKRMIESARVSHANCTVQEIMHWRTAGRRDRRDEGGRGRGEGEDGRKHVVTKNDDDLGAFVMALMKSFETLFLLRRVPVPAPYIDSFISLKFGASAVR